MSFYAQILHAFVFHVFEDNIDRSDPKWAAKYFRVQCNIVKINRVSRVCSRNVFIRIMFFSQGFTAFRHLQWCKGVICVWFHCKFKWSASSYTRNMHALVFTFWKQYVQVRSKMGCQVIDVLKWNRISAMTRFECFHTHYVFSQGFKTDHHAWTKKFTPTFAYD